MLPEALEIRYKLRLLLHDSFVVHPVEVPLLSELVPRPLGLFETRARGWEEDGVSSERRL